MTFGLFNRNVYVLKAINLDNDIFVFLLRKSNE